MGCSNSPMVEDEGLCLASLLLAGTIQVCFFNHVINPNS